MTTQLLVSKELCDALKAASDSPKPTIRAIQVLIDMEAEALELGEQLPAEGKASKDFDGVLRRYVEAHDQEACYFLFRCSTGWIVIAYLPDNAKVKQKMLYSSSKAHMQKALRKFSGKGFVDSVHFTTPEDISWKDYRSLRQVDDSLLSQHEKALREAKEAEEEARKERAMDEWRQRRRNPMLMNLQSELSAAGQANWKERREREKNQARMTLRRAKNKPTQRMRAASRAVAVAKGDVSPPPPDEDDDEDAPPPPPPDSDEEAEMDEQADAAADASAPMDISDLADVCARCDEVVPVLVDGEFENGWILPVCPACLGESLPMRERLEQAQALIDKKKGKDAEAILLEIRKATMREHSQTHFLLCLARAQQGKTEFSFAALTEALETGFDDFRTIHDLSSLKKVRAHPNFKDALMPFVCERCRKWRAVARGEFEGQQLKVCKVCVAEHSDFAKLTGTAQLCLSQRNYEAAEQWLQKMLHTSPGHPATLLLLASCYASWSQQKSGSSSGSSIGSLVSPRGAGGGSDIIKPTTAKGRERAAIMSLDSALRSACAIDDKLRKELVKQVNKEEAYASLRSLHHFKETIKKWK